MFFFLTHLIFFYSFYATYNYSFKGKIRSPFLFHINIVLLLFALISYNRAFFADAGPITIKKPPGMASFLSITCKKCKDNWKPPRAHHCIHCNKCVFRMDHHCSWINNCVASHNQKYFILFLFYTLLLSLSTFIINITGFIVWVQKQKRRLLNFDYSELHMLMTELLAGFFIFLTLFNLVQQIQLIFNNTSYIEQKNQEKGIKRNKIENFKAVFGNSKWFIPTRPVVQMNYLELAYNDDYQGEYFEEKIGGQNSIHFEFYQQYCVI